MTLYEGIGDNQKPSKRLPNPSLSNILFYYFVEIGSELSYNELLLLVIHNFIGGRYDDKKVSQIEI